MTSTTDQLQTSAGEREQILSAAAEAAAPWGALDPTERAAALTTVAEALEDHAGELLEVAQRETRLPPGRLRGELTRTTFQLGLFAELLRDGGYRGIQIDHADPDWPMGAPRPDLRRRLEPLGPVLVFAASNFPFAFSVAGGDTASALAAGCPVVLKAHPGHLELSARTGAVVSDALRAAGAPAGTFAVVFGDDSGRQVLLDPRIRAAAFTGSLRGGRALFDLATGRPDPIPFYGELSSINPVFVTRGAAQRRAAEIAAGFVASFTLGAGQFCTKPGLLVVPADSTLPQLLAKAELPEPAPLLNERIAYGHTEARQALLDHQDVRVLAGGGTDDPEHPSPTMLVTELGSVRGDLDGLFTECFGPTALVATYAEEAELVDFATVLDGQLTATIQGEESDAIVPELLPELARKAGRVLWNQWPTGVSVTYAQQHGGPYPATTAPTTTSVGTAAIERFLRPVAYQGFPAALLPTDLRDQ